VVDHLVQHLRAKDVELDGQERPVAVLWTDPKSEWKSIVDVAQARMPELLVLGDYLPEERTGPAIWLRCMVDSVLDEPSLPRDRASVIYLPGVSRQDLRAGSECRDALKPLVELMFRGVMWLQHNGTDWAVTTFLTSTKALGLDISRDQQTLQAMLRALPEVALTAVSRLAGRHLDAEDFDRMLSEDTTRDLLRHLDDPQGTKERLGANRWGAFRARCREEFGYDPESEADVVAGERLGKREGPWAGVWDRFVEAPGGFPGVVEVLRRSRPTENLAFDRETWPDINDADEEAVRAELAGITALSHPEACRRIIALEDEHGARRNWVWSQLGLSPVAQLLEPLARLAHGTQSAIGGSTLDAIADAYLDRGWQTDKASWESVDAASNADEVLVGKVVRHLLGPWLEDSARAFQRALKRTYLPGPAQGLVTAAEGGCLLFTDGLRYDVAQALAERLESRGCQVTVRHRWAAGPSVTATGKPAVTPVADAVVGQKLEKDFAPAIKPELKPANAQNLRKVMRERGYQVLESGEFDVPMESSSRGWAEFGDIDSLGHKLKGRLACHINDELDRLAERVLRLLDAGWKIVRVVTDHGWLLLPGGLPKAELPKHLTESRWARCAVIAGQSAPDIPRFPWHWNETEMFASAPGVACFKMSEEYAHGGLSLQECLTPDVLIERSGDRGAHAVITSVTWRGMRCFVEATVEGAVNADLRLGTPSGQSVAGAMKRVLDGTVSLVVSDDQYEEAQLTLVLLDDGEKVLARKTTKVGEDS
jgi:hypothetical protein